MKLKLKLDELRVEAFETTRGPADARGTVRANENTQPNCFSNQWTCFLDESCGETCDASCNQTCFNTLPCCM